MARPALIESSEAEWGSFGPGALPRPAGARLAIRWSTRRQPKRRRFAERRDNASELDLFFEFTAACRTLQDHRIARSPAIATGPKGPEVQCEPRLPCLHTWPDNSLILGDRSEAFVREALHALPFVGFGDVDIPLRVDGNAVGAEELAWLPPPVAETRQLVKRLALEDVYLLVAAVRQIKVLLLRVLRKGDVPHRPIGQRPPLDELLLH